jgi:hypothetical protein
MSPHPRTRRFIIGLALLFLVLVIGFSITNRMIPDWGSTPEERAMPLPGDEIFPTPVLAWNHAITIDAPVEVVWPWIAQMGDTRAGFYSFRFIEKAVTAAAGVDATDYYRNTNQVHPEWQAPEIGQGMILDALVLRAILPGESLVAGPRPEASEGGLQWTWALFPTPDGRTRLRVHIRIQFPGMEENQAVATALNLATFMMEKKMLDGIKLRAEGGMEPGWFEAVEILAWFAALGCGLAAARRFVTRVDWQRPLVIGLAAAAWLFVLTYGQPALWVRLVGALVLAAGLALDARLAGRKYPSAAVLDRLREVGR